MDLHDYRDVAENYDRYLDVMYSVRDNYAGFREFYLELAKQYGSGGVVDIACGTGAVLLYLAEHGIMADGFLMFMPLETYVEREQIPVISRGQFLSARITFDVYVESFSCSTDFYRKTEAGLEGLGSIDLSVSDLPDGPFLVKMDCNAVHHGEAFRFFYLFWVE